MARTRKKPAAPTILSVTTLQKSGGFVGAPVKQDIKYTLDGQQYEAFVYVRQRSCETLERDTMAAIEKRDILASRIATMICNEKGDPIFAYEDALRLREPLALALGDAIKKVNGPKK